MHIVAFRNLQHDEFVDLCCECPTFCQFKLETCLLFLNGGQQLVCTAVTMNLEKPDFREKKYQNFHRTSLLAVNVLAITCNSMISFNPAASAFLVIIKLSIQYLVLPHFYLPMF